MPSEFCSFLSADFADLLHIAFVSHEDFADPRVSKALDLMHPLAHVVERVTISHVVNYDDAMGASVVAAGKCSESLLASGVPLKVRLDFLRFEA